MCNECRVIRSHCRDTFLNNGRRQRLIANVDWYSYQYPIHLLFVGPVPGGDNSDNAYWSVIQPCRRRRVRGWLNRHKSWQQWGIEKDPIGRGSRDFLGGFSNLCIHPLVYVSCALLGRRGAGKEEWRVKRSVGYNRSSTRSSTSTKEPKEYWISPTEKWRQIYDV